MKSTDWLSERMVFGILIIVGFEAALATLIITGPSLKPEIITLIAGGIGTLGAVVGLIGAAIWKTDKTDAKAAETAAVLAAKAPDQSGIVLPPPVATIQPELPVDVVPVQTPLNVKPAPGQGL